PKVLQRLVAPVVGGVHSADPATLEFAAASPALRRGLTEHGSLVAAVRRLRGGAGQLRGGAGQRRAGRRGGASAGTRVHALAPTMAALPEALRAQLLDGGAILRTGVEVTGLNRAAATDTSTGTGTAAWTVRTSREEHLEADHLVLACPPDTARDLLRAAAPEIAGAIPQAPSAAVR